MSSTIVCPNCNTDNIAGGRFCSHCGGRLPATKEVTCSKCQSSNPSNRRYCDECGARLRQNDQSHGDSEHPESPSAGKASAFSLPTRQPGDTGELDPNSLPNWLRTGELRESDSETPSDAGVQPSNLPKLDGMPPEKKATADLPDWLVSEYDSEPIIGPPRSITTDHYLDLLSESDRQEGDPAEFSAGLKAEAKLPDWLREAGNDSDENDSDPEPTTIDGELSEWLEQLGQPDKDVAATNDLGTTSSHADDEPAGAADQPDAVEPEIPGWLSELGPANTAILSQPSGTDEDLGDSVLGRESEADWLSELGPPNTARLSDPMDFDEDEPVDSEALRRPMPDWLQELGPPNTSALSEPKLIDHFEEDSIEGSDLSQELPVEYEPIDTDLLSYPPGMETDLPEDVFLAGEVTATNWLVDPDASAEEPGLDIDLESSEDHPLGESSLKSSEPFEEDADPASSIEEPFGMDGLDEPAAEVDSESPYWLSGADDLESSGLMDSENIADLEQADIGNHSPLFDGESWDSDESTADDTGYGKLPDWIAGLGTSDQELASSPDSDEAEDKSPAAASFTNLFNSFDDLTDGEAPGADANIPRGPLMTSDLAGLLGDDAPTTPDSPSELEKANETSVDQSSDFTGEPLIHLPEETESSESVSDDSFLGFDLTGDLVPEDGDALPYWMTEEDEESQDEGYPTEDEEDNLHDSKPGFRTESTSEGLLGWLSESEKPEPEDLEIEFETNGIQTPEEKSEVNLVSSDLMDDATSDILDQQTGDSVASEPSEIPPGEQDHLNWIDDLDPSGTGILAAQQKPSEDPPQALADVGEELSGWVDNLEKVDTGELVAAAAAAAAADESDTYISDEFDLSDQIGSQKTEDAEQFDEQFLSESAPFEEDSDNEVRALTSLLNEADDEELDVDRRHVTEMFEDIFDDEELDGSGSLDWLAEPGAEKAQRSAAELPGEPIGEPNSAVPELEDSAEFEAISQQELDAEPDWLSQLEMLDSDIDSLGIAAESPGGEAIDEAAITTPPSVEEKVEETEAEINGQEPFLVDELELEGFGDGWLSDETVIEDIDESAEVPGWLETLGPRAADQAVDSQVSDDMAIADMPEWVANLKPSIDSEADSLLPTALKPPLDDEETIADLTGELGQPALPDWLQGTQPDKSGFGKLTKTQDDGAAWWGREEPDSAEINITDVIEDAGDTSKEWGKVLNDLPPSVLPGELLVQAEIPEWVKALKPRDIGGMVSGRQEPLQAATEGPLTGLRGVIGIEAIVSEAQQANQQTEFTATREQQQQAALLRRLTNWEQTPDTISLSKVPPQKSWVRYVLAALLLLAIAAGLLQPDIIAYRSRPVDNNLQNVNTLIAEAADEGVLLAFEYTPAMAGELDLDAEVLIRELVSNGSTIMTASQYAAGTAISAVMTSGLDATEIGYLPGEVVGLRRIGVCLTGDADCDQVFGRALSERTKKELANTSLIILITGERDSLVNWVEQVGANTDIPIIAAVTQSIEPFAKPYVASGQLQGIMVGLGDAALFQDEFQSDPAASTVRGQMTALTLAQTLMVIVLLAGGLIYGFSSISRNRSRASSGKL